MSKHNCQSIRELGYRSCIPYYIQFDLDLNANHLRLYTLIEQMESNPNPNVAPTFSYAWFSEIIGVEKREAMRIAKVLKDKNYISHKQNTEGKWIWATVKKEVICEEGGVSFDATGGVAKYDTGGVSFDATLNTNKKKVQKNKTVVVAVSVFSSPSDKADYLSQIIRNRQLDISNELQEEILFYVGESLDFDEVTKKINIALKLIRENKWNIPHGYKGITTKSIFEKEKAYQKEKELQYQYEATNSHKTTNLYKNKTESKENEEQYNARIARYIAENKQQIASIYNN
jgi:hypothetical protein